MRGRSMNSADKSLHILHHMITVTTVTTMTGAAAGGVVLVWVVLV